MTSFLKLETARFLTLGNLGRAEHGQREMGSTVEPTNKIAIDSIT
jgi:hypothetical protein